MSNIEKGKVFSILAALYPAEVETVLKGLSNPIALLFHEGVLYVAVYAAKTELVKETLLVRNP